jgi:carbonic anhydrase
MICLLVMVAGPGRVYAFLLAAGVTNNVRQQAELLVARSDVIKEHIEHKKLRIVAGVYGLKSGKVEWLPGK